MGKSSDNMASQRMSQNDWNKLGLLIALIGIGLGAVLQGISILGLLANVIPLWLTGTFMLIIGVIIFVLVLWLSCKKLN